MKRQALPVKRSPAPQGLLKRLSTVTRRRRQSVAATANADDFADDGSSKISRNLTVIFLVHVVAIALWFTHEHFFAVAEAGTSTTSTGRPAPPAAAPASGSRLSSSERGYVVRRGDNYATIAAAHGLTEAELRDANGNRLIESGILLRIPPRLIRATKPPELATSPAAPATPQPATQAAQAAQAPAPIATPPADSGLVDAVPADSTPPPRAQLVSPEVARQATPPAASGRTYVVQSGDTIWRISNQFKVNQDALMRANKITDPKKMTVGMTLVIP
jgi:LysM repeat protein